MFETVLIAIDDLYYRAEALRPRPDVAAEFQEPHYELSGFSAFVLHVPPGEHTVRIIGISQTGKPYVGEHQITTVFR